MWTDPLAPALRRELAPSLHQGSAPRLTAQFLGSARPRQVRKCEGAVMLPSCRLTSQPAWTSALVRDTGFITAKGGSPSSVLT